jgi:multidrug resistance efflux pump
MKRLIPLVIILTAIGAGYWWLNQPAMPNPSSAAGSTTLLGSGAIEAETIAITAELGGRVVELKVEEGDEVEAGQVLVELDKADLLAQQLQLQATLATAQTNLELVSAAARPEDIAVAQAQLDQAQVALEGAKQSWARIMEMVKSSHDLAARVNQAQAQVTQAQSNVELAQIDLKRADIQAEAASRNQSNHEAMVQNEVAQYQLQAAQTGVAMSEMALAGARQQVEHLTGIRDNPLYLIAQANAAGAAYRQAEAAVQVAQANLVAAQANPTAEDIAIAQAQAQEAEAALAAIETQLAKQTLVAPHAGLISQKLINAGELAAPGTTLLELSDIETVDLTVYIPETRIGQVKIGQQVRVYVDAYSHEQFEGVVSFIAHQAEFTPRNIQTQEERVNLVFGVKITLDNAGHRLKPGMPADAEILLTGQPEIAKPASPAAPPKPTLASATPPQSVDTPSVTATATTSPATPVVTPTSAKAEATPQVEVVAWGLNVRSGPGVEYPVVAGLAQGDIAPVLAVDPQSGWLQVQLPDGKNTGWISGNPAYVLVK